MRAAWLVDLSPSKPWVPVTPKSSPTIIRSLPRWKTDPTVRTATDPRQLPSIGGNVVTQDVQIVLRVLDLEVPVIGRQPPVDNVDDLDLAPLAGTVAASPRHDSRRGTRHPRPRMRAALFVTSLV
jgi:hypothetical protein